MRYHLIETSMGVPHAILRAAWSLRCRTAEAIAGGGEAYLESFLADERCFTMVAMEADEVAGGLVAYELVKFEQERKEFYIYDLAVKQADRRRGLATGLIVTLKAIARARGAYVIYVQADRGDDAAIALYEKLGVREDVLHFDIDPDK